MTEIEVLHPLMWDNDQGPNNWFAVSTSEGIIAYFGIEAQANAYVEILRLGEYQATNEH